jgi:hypothetical protein
MMIFQAQMKKNKLQCATKDKDDVARATEDSGIAPRAIENNDISGTILWSWSKAKDFYSLFVTL